MMRRVAAILAGMLLAACGGNVRNADVVRYDFGSLGGSSDRSHIPIAEVEVQASSWLAGPDMHFRLAYAEPQGRRSYAESRWAAPPAELLEVFLRRRMVFGRPEFNGAGCRLRLVLDELEQRYDDPQGSMQVLEIRALLTPLRGVETIARRAFLIRKRAASATAGGGAAATRDAVQALAADLEAWLETTAREKPAIVERCLTH